MPPPGNGPAPEPADVLDRELDALLGTCGDPQMLCSPAMSGLSWLVHLSRCEPLARLRELRAWALSEDSPAIDAPQSLWQLIGADELTWRHWAKRPTVQLGEAMALHHHLDPERLWPLVHGWDPHQLCEGFPGLPGRALHLLLAQQAWLPVLAQARGLVCVEAAGGAPLPDGLLSLNLEIQAAERFFRGMPIIQFRADEQFAGRARGAASPCSHRTALLDLLDRARALYRTVAEGGSYVPGDRRTEPDVTAFLRLHWPSDRPLSESLLAAMCTIVRPEGLKKGRKPGRRIGG